MTPLNKILVNLEEQHGNDQALDKAAWLAERTGAAIELFCCCFNLALRNAWLFDKEAGLHAQHAYLRQIESKLDRIAETLEGRGFSVGVDVAWDRHHSEGVIRKALRYEPDLVIHQVARHSRLGHYLLAHHDWQLLRDCALPLLLVKDHRWHQAPRIAACVDPFHEGDNSGALDRHLLQQAAWLSEHAGGSLHAVHSYQTLPQSAIFDEHVVTDYEALQKRVSQQHQVALRRLLEPFMDPEGSRCTC
ncbi:universal stress protein [Marinobacterium aestuariivivens]|uniref:Universal stress protein n=1 Tax=Marinobacterium aestuariivivens TaxID=1698799 RepID=A0ABW2A4J5_9GAMM